MPSCLDKAAAHRFRSGLLSWVGANFERFRPPRERGDAPQGQICARRKSFGELGLALRSANRRAAFRDDPAFAALVRQWLAMVDEQDAFHDLENRLGRLPHFLGVFAITESLDPGRHAEIRPRLQNVLDRGYASCIERSNWAKLDFLFLLEAAGVAHSLQPAGEILAGSSLINRPALPFVRDIDLYAITHIVFDAADFGGRDPAPAFGDQAGPICAYLHSALALCLAERNWDLAGELLLCRIWLGKCERIDRFAASRLAAAQHDSGYVPPYADREGVEPADDDQLFAHAYHSTLVSLIVSAADGEQ